MTMKRSGRVRGGGLLGLRKGGGGEGRRGAEGERGEERGRRATNEAW